MMKNTVGRNAPCRCGSGKKYKKCCLITSRASAYHEEQTRQRLSRISSDMIQCVMRFGANFLAPEQKKLMKDLFLCGHCDLPDTVTRPLIDGEGFAHWFYFRCLLDEVDTDKALSLAQHYLREKGHLLDRVSRDYVEAVCKTYYSFYEVTDVSPGYFVGVKDLLLDKECIVREKSGSTQMRPGNVIFGSVLYFSGIYTFVGLFGLILPGDTSLHLAHLKDNINTALSIGLNEDTINHFDVQEMLRESCCELLDAAFSRLPMIVNKDGQLFEFNKVKYHVHTSSDVILQKLIPILPPDDTPEILLAGAKEGKIAFPWLDKASETGVGFSILAHVTIDNHTLLLESNSTNRSATLEVLLEDYLQGDITKANHSRKTVEEASCSMRQEDESSEKCDLFE